MTTVTHWDDVSHYQANFKPTRATICKATENTNYTDPTYDDVKKRCAGVHHFGGYHFLHPGNISAQATYAHKVMGATPAMADVEEVAGKMATLAETVAFIKAYRKAGGVMNMLYLPRWAWAKHWGSVSLAPLTAIGVHIINSDYSHGFAHSSAGFKAMGGVTPVGLQYTDKPHDQNIAYMTWDAMWALWTKKTK